VRTVAGDGAAARLPIDPRIRQRRIAVKRDEGRRRLRLVVAGVAVLSVIGCGVAAAHSALLDVDHVTVLGATRTSAAELSAAAGLGRHRFMIDVDPHATAGKIERLPWVERASVTRRWPGTVKISVVERAPAGAVAGRAGGFALVDASGRVLDTVSQPPAGLLVVAGADPAPAPGTPVSPRDRGAVAVTAMLPERVRNRVAAVGLIGVDIELRLAGASPTVVRMGDASDIPAKVLALATLLDKGNVAGATVIDVRVPSAPVLTRGNPGK
jgi:cell division protein FtsQ